MNSVLFNYFSFVIFCFCFIFQISLFSQNTYLRKKPEGFNELITKKKEAYLLNCETEEISGYTIQLYNGRSLSEAQNNKKEFLKKYSDYNVQIIYEEPEYKTIIGLFETEKTAKEKYKAIKSKFRDSFVRIYKFKRSDLF